jgi:hypothetical protein
VGVVCESVADEDRDVDVVTEPTNYTKLSKKITRGGRQFNKLKPV